MNTAERKAALRADLRAARRQIAVDAAGRQRRSAAIWPRVVAELHARWDGDAAAVPPPRHVMLFESLGGEPDTAEWIDDARVRGWGVYVPEVDGEHLRVQPGDLDPALLDAVIVPGVGFTATGQRLGQGGGHYDRFLRRVRPGCVLVGVCFAEQLVDHLPVEPHDVVVDAVVAG